MLATRPLIFAVVILALSAAPGRAFPGPPLTLAERWSRADLVVYARVVSVNNIENERRAVLRAVDRMKNVKEQSADEITILTRHSSSPLSDALQKDGTVIAFLKFSPDRKNYRSEGCLSVSYHEYQQYRVVLQRLPAILDASDTKERDRLLLDWYVDCAVQPATRWNGAWGISSMQQRALDGNDPLTDSQKARLAATIISEKPPGRNALAIVTILGRYRSRSLDRYLLESLRRAHELGWKDLTRKAVESLPERLGIELESSTKQRHEEWGRLLHHVHYEMDRTADPERFEREQIRLSILWGSLSWEIYGQCNKALEHEE